MNNTCNCTFNNIWPFPVSHCKHGKKLLPEALNKLTIISNKKDSTIPDSVMNIIKKTDWNFNYNVKHKDDIL